LITPNMEGKRKDKDQIMLGIDLSDCVRDKLEELQNTFYDDYVKGWEEDRDLTGGNKPRKLHWAVTIGNPKGNCQTVRVQNQKSWELVEASLRRMKQYGDQKNCNTLAIEAFYKTIDRAHTPEVPKATTKARPTSIRETPLDFEPTSPEDDVFSGYVPDTTSLPIYKSSVQKPRDSITNRQLAEKAIRDSSASAQEAIRSQIFNIHECKEEGICSNAGGCCYVLKRSRTHHKVDVLQQDEWAKHIIVGTKNVTIDKPPLEWIAAYQDTGLNKTIMRRGKRKPDSTDPTIGTANTAQPQAVQPQAPVINYNMAPAPSAPVQSRFPYEYGHSHPYGQRAYAPPRRTKYYERQQAPLPSSPIRCINNSEALAKYKAFLLQDEAEPPRRQAIESAMDVAQAQFLDDLEILKLPTTIGTLERHKVPSGIAMLIVKRVSEFKRAYNGQEELFAAQSLMGMGNSRSTTNQLTRQPSFQPASQYSRRMEEYNGGADEPVWDEEMDFFDEW
jgi:hypothetical protein